MHVHFIEAKKIWASKEKVMMHGKVDSENL